MVELYKDIYAGPGTRSSPVTKVDKDTYTAEDTVAPIDIIQRVEDNLEAGLTGIYENMPAWTSPRPPGRSTTPLRRTWSRPCWPCSACSCPIWLQGQERSHWRSSGTKKGFGAFTEESLNAFDERVIDYPG